MALSSALFAGSSGLRSLGDTMQIIGDNIANVNTIGFKSSKADFQDLLSQSLSTMNGSTQVGSGSAIGDVSASFEPGSLETTGNATDLAIGGDGFFVLRETNGEGNYYSRAGNFGFDEDGYMVNPDGYIVQGWKLDSLSGTDVGSITDIHLNSFTSSPEESTQIQIIANLDSAGINNSGTLDLTDVWDGTANPPLAEDMYEYQTTVQIYDSLGSTHDITFYFDKTSTNGSSYEYIVTCNPSEDQRSLDSSGSTGATADSVASAARTAADVYTTGDSGGTYTQGEIDAAAAAATAAETAAADAAATVDSVAAAARTLANDYAAAAEGTYTQEEIDAAAAAATAAETAAADAAATVDSVAAAARTLADDYAADPITSTTYTQEEIDAVAAAATAAETAAADAAATVDSVAAAARALADDYAADPITTPTYTQEAIDAASAAASAAETEAADAAATVASVAAAARTLADDYAADPITTASTQEEIDASEAAATAAETEAADAAATLASVAAAARTVADDYAAAAAGTYTEEAIAAAAAAATAAETEAADPAATLASVAAAARTAADDYANAVDGGTYSQEQIDAAAAAATAAETEAADAAATVASVAAAARALVDDYTNPVQTGTYTQEQIDAAAAAATAAETEAADAAATVDSVAAVVRTLADDYANSADGGTYTQAEMDAAQAVAAAAEAEESAGGTVDSVAAAARAAADVYVNAAAGTYTQAEIDAAEAVAAAAEAGALDTSSGSSSLSGLLASGVIEFGTESGKITGISMGGLDHPSDIGDDLFSFECDFLGGENSTMNIALDFGASYSHDTGDWVPDSLTTTQFAVASNTTYKTSDGYAAGELQDINVDEEGIITGTYSNGQMTALYRVALADFQNEDGLVKEGGNLFRATIASGNAITNKPGTNGLGSIAPGSLEQSNVDIADEFVRMITTQRGYQANSKIITTVDTMLSELMNLKR
ncbi:flagellar hook-basal body complex protein [Desulfocicer niacini]